MFPGCLCTYEQQFPLKDGGCRHISKPPCNPTATATAAVPFLSTFSYRENRPSHDNFSVDILLIHAPLLCAN